jgi:flagellar biosynthesis protein FlhG
MSEPAIHPAASPRQRNILCVASGKGGVGKTFLSISLTHALARQGKRVLLFDGDLGLANIDVQLGLMAERDLGGVIAGRLSLPEAVTRYEAGSFDVIAGRSGSGSLATLGRPQLLALRDSLKLLASRYDWVVLDLAAGVDEPVRLLAEVAGTLLVVTTDEPTALTDAYAFLKLTAAPTHHTDCRVVVNLAASTEDGERTFQKLRKTANNFLRLDPVLAGVVRRDDRVRDSVRHQMSHMARHPGSDSAADIEAIARGVIGAP